MKLSRPFAKLLIPEPVKVSEHSPAPPDKEYAICNYTFGEQREDGSIEIGVTLPCNRSFGLRCLAKGAQRAKACPMYSEEIPAQVVTDMVSIYQNQEDASPAHSGRTCPHNEFAFDDREYVLDGPDDEEQRRLISSLLRRMGLLDGHTFSVLTRARRINMVGLGKHILMRLSLRPLPTVPLHKETFHPSHFHHSATGSGMGRSIMMSFGRRTTRS